MRSEGNRNISFSKAPAVPVDGPAPGPATGRAGPRLVSPVHPARPWILGATYFVAVAVAALAPRHSGNVFSRYMTIESIVERGTLAIEDSPLLERSGSPDLVKFGSHLYSDKPPVLSALGALV